MAGLFEGGNEPPGSLKAIYVDDPNEFVSATYSTSLHSSEKGKEKNLQAFHGNLTEKKKKFKVTKGPRLGSERSALYSSIDITSYVLRLAFSDVIVNTNLGESGNIGHRVITDRKASCYGTTDIIERIPNLSAEQSVGITVFRIPPMTSLMLHRCRTGAINLQRW
ncbi:hypothetical protein ANN_21961 [Periplaneta americana]|uniref:Uncharacterized protein n=1 Tax=Periplaneta americana TaxID=6978 RepID=A0ABQ8S7S6_PERAM|nr:hypothetical protein ANN_21961 [Periplaneta americana]